jgi:ubiquinone/menaquinone biosynthesis C-methylase UbiE
MDTLRRSDGRVGQAGTPQDYVKESRFGHWFLGTYTWEHHVVERALKDLVRIMDRPDARYPVVLDAGCGQGKALHALTERFHPERLIGLDVEPEAMEDARAEAARHGLKAELVQADCAATGLPGGSVDLVFCHQTLHHLARQEETLKEFHRVLKPGGVLLLAESTRAYIHSWVIRLLFRHPMHVQRTAEGYLALVREAGFAFEERNVSYPYLWWSRAMDFGLLETLHIKSPPPHGLREETLINLVARKPV